MHLANKAGLSCFLVLLVWGFNSVQGQQLDRTALHEIARQAGERWVQSPLGDRSKKMADSLHPSLKRAPFHAPQRLPLAYEPANLGAARAVKVNQVWMGGIAGLHLTGQGQTIGYWDADTPRLTHQEFDGRVSFVDTSSSTANNKHTTQMVGTLVASGMAYQGAVEAYK